MDKKTLRITISAILTLVFITILAFVIVFAGLFISQIIEKTNVEDNFPMIYKFFVNTHPFLLVIIIILLTTYITTPFIAKRARRISIRIIQYLTAKEELKKSNEAKREK
jgi:uncharacterized BrkB/YihY/UPF0761 family membrane protein